MGTFHVGCRVENHVQRERSARIPKLLVDTGIMPEKKDMPFVMANGQVVTRDVGFAIIRVDKHFTIDEVVFARKGDLQLLGSRTLEGLNLTVHPREKRLVAAGPVLAA